jgi:hypothetical protein|tara:strand:- start:365 stop:1465 length:1101 start_codon:yes stop_codon:yes gene_type:complete
MRLIITKKQSRRLIKEALGVPKSVEFWVDTFSSIINDGLLMLLSSDDKEVFFNGSDVQEKAISRGWNSSNDKFLDFPLAEPQLNLKLHIVPDENIHSGDDYINSASFDTTGIDLVDATFDDGKTLPLLVGGLIKIEINIPESYYENGSFVELYNSEIKPYAESIFFHELTHVYEFYKRILSNTAKPNFEQAANLTQMMNKMGAVDDWDELMFMIYLHLSFELNARVSEVYGLLRNKKIESKSEFIDFLKTSRAFSYAKRLSGFNADTFIESFDVPQETIDRVREYDGKKTSLYDIKIVVLEQLIQNWSTSYEDFLKDFSTDETIKIPNLSPKTISSPKNFLKFWQKRFNKAGQDSLRKISRLYSAI